MNEQVFRSFIENNPDSILLINPPGKILYANPSATSMLGYSLEEMVGHILFALIHPDDYEIAMSNLTKLIENPEQGIAFELRIQNRDKMTLWIEGTATNLLADQNNKAILYIFRDVTSRKRIQLQLQEQNRTLNMLMNRATLKEMLEDLLRSVELHSTDGMIASILLLSEEGTHLQNGIAPSLPEEYLAAINGIPIGPCAGSCGTAVFRREPVFVSDINTDPLWADYKELALTHDLHSCWSTPIWSSKDKILGTFAVYYRRPHYPSSDDQQLINFVKQASAIIIERQQAQERLHFHAHILHYVTNSIIATDLTGRMIYWNRETCNLYGYTAEELSGKSPTFLYPELHYQQMMNELEYGEVKEYQQEQKCTKKDGTLLWIDLKATPLRNEEEQIIGSLVVGTDITERKKLEKSKDEFLGIASHELRTPVTSIKAFTHILQRRFAKTNDVRTAEILQKMDNQFDKLTRLIENLLDITKLEEGKLGLDKTSFSFEVLVDEIIEEMQTTTASHTLFKEGSIDEDIYGDRDRLGQVLINLLSNAIKYSPQAQNVIVKLRSTSETVYCCVQDFGPGIPQEKQQKLFNRFYRVEEMIQNAIPGMGLGLYISAEIVKRHGGHIWVESETGKGSSFCFTLPAKKAEIL